MRSSPWRRLRQSAAVALSLSTVSLLLALTSCSSTGFSTVVVPAGPTPTTQWVVGWGAGLENATTSTANPGGTEQSFRFIILPTIDATEERVHFSNLLGKGAVTIGAARLAAAVDVGPAIDATRDAALTFSGSSSVTLAAGQEIVSDPVKITYAYGEKLMVSLYLKGTFGALNQHDSQVQTNFATASGAGNATTDSSGKSFGTTNTEWFMLSGMDVYGSYQGTVAIYGSSSVDGHASNDGDTESYPNGNAPVPGQDNDRPSDWLARRLLDSGYRMGVLNAGALGDPAGEDASTLSGGAIAGVDRMQHDVIQQTGVKSVIIYFGGVDLRNNCDAATDVEASLANMAAQGNAAGLRVILATIPPSEYCTTQTGFVPTDEQPFLGDINPGPENSGSIQRRAVNTWIRTTGLTLPGVVAVADFDHALAYSLHPDFMIPSLNSGDNFHPNGVGYGIQNSAIPITSILGQ